METLKPIPEPDSNEEKSDFRVVMQFFIVPLVLVVVLVVVFFGMQILRSRRPDPTATLRSLRSYDGFLSSFVGDLKRWQYGYDLSLLMRADSGELDSRLVPELIASFDDAGEREDLRLRRYLALALGQAADPRAVPHLAGAMGDDDPQTRVFAAWGLMRTGGPGALVPLRHAVGDADGGVRKMAVFALGELRDSDGIPVLKTALADSETDVGWNAALSLARLGDHAAVPMLLRMLEAEYDDTIGIAQGISAAAGSAALPTGKPAADTAIATTNADEPSVRGRVMNAIRGLALLAAPEAVEPLRRIVADAGADPGIGEAARLALQSLPGESQSGLP